MRLDSGPQTAVRRAWERRQGYINLVKLKSEGTG